MTKAFQEEILDWSNMDNVSRILKKIKIKSDNNKEFDECSYDWICQITSDFGNTTDQIEASLKELFFKNFQHLKLYHATKILNPHNISKNGLKKLSPELIYDLILNANIKLKKADKNEILANYERHIKATTGERRSHIYLCIDKFHAILKENGELNTDCSFFRGSEAMPWILPEHIKIPYNKLLEDHGKRTIVTANIPLDCEYIENETLRKLPLQFFCLWFNNTVLKKEPFRNHSGLNIKQDIPPNLIKEIKTP